MLYMVIFLWRGINFVVVDERFDFYNIKKINVKFKLMVLKYEMNNDVKMYNYSFVIFWNIRIMNFK